MSEDKLLERVEDAILKSIKIEHVEGYGNCINAGSVQDAAGAAIEALGVVLLDSDELPQVGDVVDVGYDDIMCVVTSIYGWGFETNYGDTRYDHDYKIIQRQGKPAVYKGGVDE